MTKQGKTYLLITFLITWGCWWSLSVLSINEIIKFGQIPFWILYIIGGNGPFIAALITKKVFSDKEQYRNFISQLFKIKTGLNWYLWTIIILFILNSIPWLIYSIKNGFSQTLFSRPIYMVILMIPVMVIGGGLEEVGWRGVLLPDMLNKLSKILSSLFVGIIWAMWHLPLWFIKGVPQENFNFLTFIISVLGLSLLLTILYDKTKSIFMCVIFHSLTNSYGTVINTQSLNPILDTVLKLLFCISIFLLSQNISHKKYKDNSVIG